MLRSYWRHILAAIGGLAALAVITSASLYSYREFYEPAEYEYPAERYQPARDALEPTFSAKQQPAAKGYDPKCNEPQNRDDADLCAQWSAVRAVHETNRLTRAALKLGFVGFWVAMLGGILGAVGTVFLVMTFRENKRAADAAHDANRPWLEVEIVHVGQLTLTDDKADLKIQVKVTNQGNSPAVNVITFAALDGERGDSPGLYPGKAVNKLGNTLDIWTPEPLGSRHGTTAFPGGGPTQNHVASVRWDEILNARSANSVFLTLAVGVTYRFSGKVGRTVVSFFVVPVKGNSMAVEIPEPNVEHLAGAPRLDDNFASYAT